MSKICSKFYYNSAIKNYRVTTPSFSKVNEILKSNNCYPEERDKYIFESKFLRAQWFKPQFKGYPRVFVSEIMDDLLSQKSRNIIQKYIIPNYYNNNDTNSLVVEMLNQPNLQKVKYSDYLALNEESNYAAWTLVHGCIVNHETIPVHNLIKFNNLEECLSLLKSNGIELMIKPQLIKISNDRLLLQSSSVSDSVSVDFLDTVESIPGSFVEYIERKTLPEYQKIPKEFLEEHHRREGFELGNAFFIFDSTKRMSQKHD